MVDDLDTIDLSRLLENTTDDAQARSEIANYCRINLRNLTEALERHPALYAYAVACLEMAKVDEARKKWNYETQASTAFQFLKDQDPKMSDGSAEKKLKTIPAVAEAVKSMHNAMDIVGRLKGLVGGLEHRRDMLVQISAKQRQQDAG